MAEVTLFRFTSTVPSKLSSQMVVLNLEISIIAFGDSITLTFGYMNKLTDLKLQNNPLPTVMVLW